MQRDELSAAFQEEQTALNRFHGLAYQEIQECRTALSKLRIPGAHSGDVNNVQQDIAGAFKFQKDNQIRIDEVSGTLDEPYFVRFNIEDDKGKTKTVYIGEQSVSLGRSDFMVYRWQEAGGAPLIDYLMRNEFSAPFQYNGTEQTCLLKRKIEIARRRLLGVDDEYISDELYAQLGINDPFLIKVIKQRREEGIHAENIISTIQRNQYEIISYSPDQNIIVQGCAGSGKTYIMMNRLSYLLLNRRRFNIASDDAIVISPNPRIKDQLRNVVKNLSIIDVPQIAIEDLYLSILQLLFGVKYDNYILAEEAALPNEYVNTVFSNEFIARVREAIQSERKNIINEGLTLLENPAMMKYTEFRENTPAAAVSLESVVSSVRDINSQVRKQRDDFSKYCRENNITDEMLESTSVNDDVLLVEIEEMLAEIDGRLSQLIGLQPLFEEYNTAKELFAEEEASFNRHFTEARERLQNSMEQMKDLSSMPAKSRTDLVTRHLRYETDVASFEVGGVNEQIHQKQLAECRMLIQESLEKITPLLPVDYQSSSDQAWDQILMQITSLMQQKQELSERGAQISENRRMKNQAVLSAIKLKSELLEEHLAKSVESYARRNASLARQAISIVRSIISKEKEKHQIAQAIRQNDVNSKQEKHQQVLYRSDLFFYVFASYAFLNRSITKWKMICIDEAQDLSSVEFAFMQKAFKGTYFSIFGDLSQSRLNRKDSLQSWESCFPQAKRFVLNENYRNARQITQFINDRFSRDMIAIGIDGKLSFTVRSEKAFDGVKKWIAENEHAIIIVKNRAIIKRIKELSEAILSSEHTEVYTIDEVRGLEFSKALVLSEGMDDNEKYIAFTRAMSELVIV